MTRHNSWSGQHLKHNTFLRARGRALPRARSAQPLPHSHSLSLWHSLRFILFCEDSRRRYLPSLPTLAPGADAATLERISARAVLGVCRRRDLQQQTGEDSDRCTRFFAAAQPQAAAIWRALTTWCRAPRARQRFWRALTTWCRAPRARQRFQGPEGPAPRAEKSVLIPGVSDA